MCSIPLVSFSSSPAWQKPQRWPPSPGLVRRGERSRCDNTVTRQSTPEAGRQAGGCGAQPGGRHVSGDTLTCEELSSSAACAEAERKASDWPRDETLQRAFSNRPRPRLWGGDVSESLATPSSSSKVGAEKEFRKNKSRWI